MLLIEMTEPWVEYNFELLQTSPSIQAACFLQNNSANCLPSPLLHNPKFSTGLSNNVGIAER